MSIKAQINVDSKGDIIVHMSGGLDFENSAPLKQELESLSEQNPFSNITLDLNAVDFVGSSGIGIFVETIKSLNKNKNKIKLSNVKSEFIRVFKLFDFDVMDAINIDFDSDDTDDLNQKYGNRSHTFQN